MTGIIGAKFAIIAKIRLSFALPIDTVGVNRAGVPVITLPSGGGMNAAKYRVTAVNCTWVSIFTPGGHRHTNAGVTGVTDGT